MTIKLLSQKSALLQSRDGEDVKISYLHHDSTRLPSNNVKRIECCKLDRLEMYQLTDGICSELLLRVIHYKLKTLFKSYHNFAN